MANLRAVFEEEGKVGSRGKVGKSRGEKLWILDCRMRPLKCLCQSHNNTLQPPWRSNKSRRWHAAYYLCILITGRRRRRRGRLRRDRAELEELGGGKMKYNGRRATKWTLVNATAAGGSKNQQQSEKKLNKIKIVGGWGQNCGWLIKTINILILYTSRSPLGVYLMPARDLNFKLKLQHNWNVVLSFYIYIYNLNLIKICAKRHLWENSTDRIDRIWFRI